MRAFVLLALLGIAVLFNGCAARNAASSAPDGIACVVKVSNCVVDADALILIEAVIYDETSGEILAAPRLATQEGETAELFLQEKGTNSFTLSAPAFGEKVYESARGVYLAANCRKNPDGESVNVKLLTLYQEDMTDDRIAVRALNAPDFTIPLAQPVLVLQRDGVIIHMPADLELPENLKQIQRFSPNFPVELKNSPLQPLQ